MTMTFELYHKFSEAVNRLKVSVMDLNILPGFELEHKIFGYSHP